ncbi:hypothetical protein U9M48_022514 [Paspalum notatum var. saurae]|uniref:Reverse transcriptase zinc-binding domain-containing protein n=1 Tax=Paspalum notatum var. saurae TaxID=547442 RepID=A0AAQ3TMC6_PASNO
MWHPASQQQEQLCVRLKKVACRNPPKRYGDGATALFWVDCWIDGMAIETLTPNLIRAVPPRFRRRSVRDGLHNRTWVSDIRGALTETMVVEYVELWERIRHVSLSVGVPDSFRWRFEPVGTYSSSSAYCACFVGSTLFLGAKFIWKAKVPPKVKFFVWLAAQDRCWTAERRYRRGLQEDDECALCDQESETIVHLLLLCSFSKHVWFLVFGRLGWHSLTPELGDEIMVWWSRIRKRLPKELRKGCDALVLLVLWMIWKERNSRVFDRGGASPQLLVSKLLAKANLWELAGFNALPSLAPLAASMGAVIPSGSQIFYVM